nr:MAG TPA: hypothetical protein [Bacteriophage sp.]
MKAAVAPLASNLLPIQLYFSWLLVLAPVSSTI